MDNKTILEASDAAATVNPCVPFQNNLREQGREVKAGENKKRGAVQAPPIGLLDIDVA